MKHRDIDTRIHRKNVKEVEREVKTERNRVAYELLHIYSTLTNRRHNLFLIKLTPYIAIQII